MSLRTEIANEINAEVREARRTIDQATYVAREIAPLLVGRLRGIDHETLAEFKRELNAFDLRTMGWRP